MKHPKPIYDNNWELLSDGETIRVHCNHWKCEEKKDAFTITKITNGCVYNCYRCGISGAVFKGRSPNEALKYITRIRSDRRSNMCGSNIRPTYLPVDFIPLVIKDKRIPPHAYAWLYRYELNDLDFNRYYIGYSPRLERVIIPIYNKNNKLIAWQGRDIYYKRNTSLYNKSILRKKPLKYYTEYNSKQNNDSKLYYNIYNKHKSKNIIIIVEDILSAIKVHNKFKCNVTAILNSTLNNNIITDLSLRDYGTVYIWLDPDAAIKSIQGALRWRSLGINALCQRTDTDPKEVPYSSMSI